jgi:transcription elongation factor Elf1
MIYTTIKTTEKLKPCPFCGCEGELRLTDQDGAFVQCKNCGIFASGYSPLHVGFEKKAIDFWNKRSE